MDDTKITDAQIEDFSARAASKGDRITVSVCCFALTGEFSTGLDKYETFNLENLDLDYDTDKARAIIASWISQEVEMQTCTYGIETNGRTVVCGQPATYRLFGADCKLFACAEHEAECRAHDEGVDKLIQIKDFMSGTVYGLPSDTPAFSASDVEDGGEDQPILAWRANRSDASELGNMGLRELFYVRSGDEADDEDAPEGAVNWYLSERVE